MKTYYSIRIKTKELNYRLISILLNLDIVSYDRGWIYEVVVTESDEYKDILEHFILVLEGKYEGLDKLGVTRNDISLWIIYEYSNQCNFEFSPKQLKRVSDNELSLCISCYEI